MIVHDGATGNKIWQETADVRVYGLISFTNTADPSEKDIPVNQSVRKAARDLLRDFLNSTKGTEQVN